MKDCTFPRCGCSEREQCRPEKHPFAAIDLTQFDGHTPGPWKAHEKGAHTHRFVTWMTEASDFPGDKKLVAYAVGMDSEPNARLIAAAPDLLAAYKAALARAETAEAEVKHARDEEAKWEQIAKIAETRAEAAERQRDEAWTAGAEAMREACANLPGKWLAIFSDIPITVLSPEKYAAAAVADIAEAIRALPIPAQEGK